MQFTRLRLNGFKSFVDQTDLVIHPGLTGVVGPNGCGKSNLLEALRWVMGENRPTAMRGGGMEDVIFAGTDTRGARHFAEVSLHLDNGERLAPAGFNDNDTLDVVRRITRDAGSAYKVNGKDARARDVQMLFADASTGAHSPALVRQGQISELINARPRARRRILEEAAGIAGLYQRRHEAELRLRATETNLDRVSDVIEQLAQQLAQLSRQARQAERYRQIGARLRQVEGMLFYRRWREAEAARQAADAAFQTALQDSARAEADARQAATARTSAEEALSPLREEETVASAILQRLEVERDTIAAEQARAAEAVRTLNARITQLAQDITREAGLNQDAQGSIAQLEAEEERLHKAMDGQDARLSDAEHAATEASEALRDHEAQAGALTEEVAQLAAQHQSAERQITDLTRSHARAEDALRSAQDARHEAEARLQEAAEGLAGASDAATDAQALLERADDTLSQAEAARTEAQDLESAARATLAEAEGAASTLRAEHSALAKVLERDSGDSAGLLAELRVAPGYEQALGAALADDLRAPPAAGGSGWVALAPYSDAPGLPTGAQALAPHVSGTDLLSRRLSQTGLVPRAEGAGLQPALRPGQRLVSTEGDLWRWDGLHVAADDATSATARRLQQANQLDRLQADLAQADARLVAAREAHAARKDRLDALASAEADAHRARRAAEQNLSEAARSLSRLESARDSARARLDGADAQLAQLQGRRADLARQLEQAKAQAADLPPLGDARARSEAQRSEVERARQAMLAARARVDELRRAASGRATRLREVTKSLDGWRNRLASAAQRVAELEARKAEAEDALAEASSAPDQFAARQEALADEIARANTRRTAARDALSAGEAQARACADAERQAERHASESREDRARREALRDAARDSVDAAAERLRDEMDCEPEELLARLEIDPDTMPDASVLDAELTRLRRARDALGAVNLRAEEDAAEIRVEHDMLVQEKADLEAAVTKLRDGITALNREGRERLLAAFDKVNENFTTLFKHLFAGGEARLVLVESDDPLEAGLEIMCQPPGKKLSTLSLLSGGEQTLTALALIFAVFLANPAPICVLDEVDAPLDDANVARFCDLLDEMTRRTQTRYLIITHNAISMARMDRLFGVTMAERGVSQLVSVDLRQAETMVA